MSAADVEYARLLVMPGADHRPPQEDRLVIDGKEYTATQIREALALTEESRNVYED